MLKRTFLLFTTFILACCNTQKENAVEFQEFEIGVVADCQYRNCETVNNRNYKK